MNTTQFTVKTTRPGWADLFLNGEKVGFLMSYNTGYGYWKATVWNNELRQILVDGGARNFDANTRKALLERLNNAIEMVLV